MPEGDPKGKKDNNSLSDFDRLIGAVKRLQQRAQEEGKTTPDSPAIDNYIKMRKKQAGSPPSALEPEKS